MQTGLYFYLGFNFVYTLNPGYDSLFIRFFTEFEDYLRLQIVGLLVMEERGVPESSFCTLLKAT